MKNNIIKQTFTKIKPIAPVKPAAKFNPGKLTTVKKAPTTPKPTLPDEGNGYYDTMSPLDEGIQRGIQRIDRAIGRGINSVKDKLNK